MGAIQSILRRKKNRTTKESPTSDHPSTYPHPSLNRSLESGQVDPQPTEQAPSNISFYEENGSVDPSLLGVSLDWLSNGFLEDVEAAGFNLDSKIYEIENLQEASGGVIRRKGKSVICPLTHKVGAAYVHCLNGPDQVGPASFMLSYTWSYSLGDILDTLHGFCESKGLDPIRTYFWICCLCNNQHRVVESRGEIVPTHVFLENFHHRVLGVGKLVCMMDPWESPRYLSRAWCIFEYYTALSNNCETFIVMPPREKDRMIQALFGGEEFSNTLTGLYDALSNTKVENAEASVEQDKLTILDILERGQGTAATNTRVNENLRSWLKKAVSDHLQQTRAVFLSLELDEHDDRVESHMKYAGLCYRVGTFFQEVGEMETALKIFQENLEVTEGVKGSEHPATADSYNNIGLVFQEMGRYDEALAEVEKALLIRQAKLGPLHPSTANSFNNVGSVLDDLQRYDEALENHQKAVRIQEIMLGIDDLQTAISYNNVGSVLRHMGRDEEAVAEYRKCLAIEEARLGKAHPSTAGTHHNLGTALYYMGDKEQALREYKLALVNMEKSLGVEHPHTKSARIGIANINRELASDTAYPQETT